jgi:hypothetical protein
LQHRDAWQWVASTNVASNHDDMDVPLPGNTNTPRHRRKRNYEVRRYIRPQRKLGQHWALKEGKTFTDIWDPDTILVPNRLVRIFSITPEQVISNTVPMTFEIEASERDEACIRVQLYSSLERTLDHKAAFDSKEEPKRGLTGWPISYVMIHDLESYGFEPKKATNNCWYYTIRSAVRMLRRPDHLEVEIGLLRPGQSYVFREGERNKQVRCTCSLPLTRIQDRIPIWKRTLMT